jgi:hypothetical protein
MCFLLNNGIKILISIGALSKQEKRRQRFFCPSIDLNVLLAITKCLSLIIPITHWKFALSKNESLIHMKNLFLTFTLIFLTNSSLLSQTIAEDLSVQVHAEINPSTPSINLIWPLHDDASSYSIYRRIADGASWGSPIASLSAQDSSYLDSDIVVGEAYEYRIIKNGSPQGYGYILSGIELPSVEKNRIVILVTDSTQANQLIPEINRWILDVEGDGWAVKRIDVSPDDEVSAVKGFIQTAYNEDPVQTEAVFLLGHVPVPYSGNIYPDGHTDHQGAWPADMFYGEMDGNWTDQSVNNTTASDSRNHNIPGDGKYDQSYLPSDAELPVGRVDMHKLPAFSENETELLRKYLDKNHAFRHANIPVQRRGLIENNFPSFQEGFAQNGWKNFSAMFGPEQVQALDYTGVLTQENYLWSYGCGGGSYTSCGGVVNTSGFASDSIQSIFTILFGSYFGDWDRQNNLLRAALASGTILTNCWAGRPNWQFHHMAMGYPIGFSTKLSQNSSNTQYVSGFGARSIHIALMGDPTLRMHPVDPPSNLLITEAEGHALLNWEASTEDDPLYHIYRKSPDALFFERITDGVIEENNFVDSCLTAGEEYDYLVRTVKLELTASGSYVNLSQGIHGQIEILTDHSVTAGFDFQLDGGQLELNNLSLNADQYLWDFGDGNTSNEANPIHYYTENDTYTVTLYAWNDCSADTLSINIGEVTNTRDLYGGQEITLFPNPGSGQVYISLPVEKKGVARLYSLEGTLLFEKSLSSGTRHQLSGLETFGHSIFILQLQFEDGISKAFRIIVN